VIATFDLAAPREWVDFLKELEGRPQGAFGQANPLRTNAKMRSAIDWAISMLYGVRRTTCTRYVVITPYTQHNTEYQPNLRCSTERMALSQTLGARPYGTDYGIVEHF
jgi:hypothetical protein